MSWVRKQMLMLAAVAVISGGAARGDKIIGTSKSDGFANPFGIPDTQTYGQTITAPTDGNSTLQSFTFYLTAAATLAFRGEVYAWDGTKATGPALFESAPISASGSPFIEPFTFNTGGVGLTADDSYVIFVSSSKDNAGHSGTGNFEVAAGTSADGGYDGGSFFYLNNMDDPSLWTSQHWTKVAPDSDLMFQADFNSAAPGTSGVPLPRTALTGLGLLGLAGMMMVTRRRLAGV